MHPAMRDGTDKTVPVTPLTNASVLLCELVARRARNSPAAPSTDTTRPGHWFVAPSAAS